MHFTQEDYKKIENWLLMNSVKDSEFQEALPLNGSETVVVTQGGHNRNVTVQKLSNKVLELGEQSSKTIYVWNWDGSEGGAFSQGEFDKIRSADIVVIKMTIDGGEQQYVAERTYDSVHNVIALFIHTGSEEVVITIGFTILPEGWEMIDRQIYSIPTKVSELDNDSKFVEEENLATINGKKLTEKGNIVIEGGSKVEVVDSLASDASDKALSAKQGKVLKTEMDSKASLDESGKILVSELPDYILGQVMFGGLIHPNGSISASSNFISKYGNITSLSESDAPKYSGVYFIVGNDVLNIAIIGVSTVSTGDWIISTGGGWRKVDNTDAVSTVAGLNGNIQAPALAKKLAESAGEYSLALKSEIGKANVQSNWLENDPSSDAYIKHKTHNFEGLTITKAGNYNVTTDNNRVYFAGTNRIYYLDVGVRTQIWSGPPIYVTLNSSGILIVEDSGYLEAYPLVSISSITPLDDMFIPEHILREGNLKTINGQSLIGEGNIEISGGETSVTQAYAPLKYIGSTGTQYIDTGIVLTREDIISLDFTIPDAAVAVATDKILIDARDDSNGVRVSTWGDNKKWYVRFGHNSGASSTAQSAAIRQGSLVFSKDSLIVNGVTVLSDFAFTAMPTSTLKLLSGVTPEGAISGPSYARISSCKVIRGDETILNLTPAQRVEDGAIGMRDLVSGEFFVNSGTGLFEYELAPVAGEVTVKKYPSLTDEQKAAMQALMDDYYNNRGTFYYEFTHNRNAFTSGSQCYDSTRGKFKQCCATFVQHLMMGRSINDFLGKTASTYSSKITKTDVSKFGYYFDFKYRKYLYGLTDTDENGETTYYGYVQPNADNFEGSYSYNSYYHPDSSRAKKQNFNGFCNANDMARELYEMGCEIPFSELEIGDIIFTYDNDLADSSSMFNFVAWRNIYHVGMVYDVKQIDASSKEIYYIECTSYFDTETRPIEKPFLSSSQMDLRFKAFKLTEDMAFCARMPSVFGYEPNVPDQITSSPTP